MLSDAGLVVAGNAVDAAITHLQAHSGARGVDGTANVIGARVPVNGTVDGDGDVTWTNTAFTGLPANSPVAEVSYWSALTAGTYYGGSVRASGDATANSLGEYTITSLTENNVAT